MNILNSQIVKRFILISWICLFLELFYYKIDTEDMKSVQNYSRNICTLLFLQNYSTICMSVTQSENLISCFFNVILFYLLMKKKNFHPVALQSWKLIYIFFLCFLPLQALPPKFASTVLDLVDNKTHLEDLSGRKWEVTVSKLNGSLAFCEGWQAFALDRRLEIGDIVVFHYIMRSHFVAWVYYRTVCEKPTSSENMRQQKVRKEESPVSKDCSSQKTDKRSTNEHVSSTSVLPGSEIGLINSQGSATVPRIIENTLNRENSGGKLKSVSKLHMPKSHPTWLVGILESNKKNTAAL